MGEAGGTNDERVARARAADRARDAAALFQHCSGGGIGLSDGSEEATEDCLLLHGEAGCLEGSAGILALAADDVGHRDLLGSLRHRVSDGVATVQDRALIGLLRDDLAFGDRVGERLGRCSHEAKALNGALCGIGVHPVQRRHREGLTALRQHHINGAVVRQL